MSSTPTILKYLAAALLATGLLACGSHGGDGSNTAIPNTEKSLLPGMVQLRWFPVADARGYLLEVTDDSGQLISDEMATPTGCTHDTLEGYTSGLCAYVFRLPQPGKNYTVKLKSFNELGESDRSIRRIRW